MSIKTRAVSLAVLGLLVCAGCEDDPMDLDYLKDSGVVDAGKDSGSDTTATTDAGQDAGVDAAVGSDDAGSDDAGSDAG